MHIIKLMADTPYLRLYIYRCQDAERFALGDPFTEYFDIYLMCL